MDIHLLPERFRNKFVVNEDTGCWEWVAAKTPDGYGNFYWEGWTQRSHRVAYKILVGAIPRDKECDHLCRNRSCCNPAHLQIGSHEANMNGAVILKPWNGAKTHCKHGHPFDEANTYHYDGRRKCRQCRQDANKRSYDKKKRAGLPCP